MFVAVVILLLLYVGIFVFVRSNTKETGGNEAGSKTEQSQGSNDEGTEKGHNEDSNDNQSSTLEVLQPDEVAPEDSSNASGYWGDTSQSNPQTEDMGNKIDKTENEKPIEEDKKDNDEEQQKDEDILEDDISWGNIY